MHSATALEVDSLVLPDAQLYIVVAIFFAVASMIATDIREDMMNREAPRKEINRFAKLILVGAWGAVAHIYCAVISENNLITLPVISIIGMVFHCLVIFLLLLIVTMWYRVFAFHKEGMQALPVNPPVRE